MCKTVEHHVQLVQAIVIVGPKLCNIQGALSQVHLKAAGEIKHFIKWLSIHPHYGLADEHGL
jgi:hypothetical protein